MVLPGGFKLSEGRRNEESNAGAAVWGKVWSSEVGRSVLKEAVQGMQGLPLKAAPSQGSELMATRHSSKGQQHFSIANVIQCSVLAGKD